MTEPPKKKRGRPRKLTDEQRKSVVVSFKLRPGDAQRFKEEADALRHAIEKRRDYALGAASKET